MQSIVDDLLVTCNDIEDTSKGVVINFHNRISYWLIAVGL